MFFWCNLAPERHNIYEEEATNLEIFDSKIVWIFKRAGSSFIDKKPREKREQ